jgi:hypothetical protein
MKPLILILLAAISLEAQNVADAARQERERQAQAKSTRVFTDGNAHLLNPIAPSGGAVPSAGAAKAQTPATTPATTPAMSPATTPAAAKSPAAAPVAAAATAPVDPAQEEIQKLRLRIRALDDQDTALKLQIADFTNQVYSPLTDQASHNEALTKLGETQAKQSEIQKELAQTRSKLLQLESGSAPKK